MNFQENVFVLVETLDRFDYTLSIVDHRWDIIFPDQKNKWHHVRVTKSYGIYYVFLVDGELSSLEVKPKKGVEITPPFEIASPFGNRPRNDDSGIWNHLIVSSLKWLKHVKKNWINANQHVQKNYPFNRRKGIAPNALVRASILDIYRIDRELGKAKMRQFINIAEGHYFHDSEKTKRTSMTANDYFEYCKIAYLAAQRKDEHVDSKLSGRELYERYADGRHEGLLDIKANSPSEFAQWIDGEHPKVKRGGGHPWEVKRGGNTTHIDLSVSRSSYHIKEGFVISLSGDSIGRLKETICMFLAIHEAGLPITIENPEGIRKRLLAQDNIGIIPEYDLLHRANQEFYEEQAVFDVMYFDDLGRYKTRIKPFITWEPLPILKPRGIF